MTANVQLNTGTGGDLARAVDRGSSVKTTVVALDLNPNGTETLSAPGTNPAASSLPVVHASEALGSQTISTVDSVNTGPTTGNAVTGTPTTGSAAGLMLNGTENSVLFQLRSGPPFSSGFYNFEFSPDATSLTDSAAHWYALIVRQEGGIPGAIDSWNFAFPLPGLYSGTVHNASAVRVRATGSGGGSGSTTALVKAGISTNAVAVMSPTQAGSALIGQVVPVLSNGSTNDAWHNNFNTPTGDTGAKSASGNGATQTNFNGRGAMIAFNVGAFVGGTSPTITFRIQWSADGTNWNDLAGAATSSISSSSVATLMIYPSVAAVANLAVSAPLPRTWRTAWAITGSPTSITITSIQVALIN